MRRRFDLVSCMFSLVVVGYAQDAGRLTIDEAIQIGKERSAILRASRARAEGSSARASEANASLFPSLKVDASYRRLSTVPSFGISLPLPGFQTPIAIFPMIPDNYQLHASVQQPLFTGFKLMNNARAARIQSEAGEWDVRNDEADCVVSVTTAYWTLFQAREAGSAADENVTRLETYERDTRNLLSAGMATKNDLLRIQVQLQNARLSRIDAQNEAEVAMMNLNVAMGRTPEASVFLGSMPSSSDSLENPVVSVDRGVEHRSDIAAASARVEASEAALAATRGSFWPQVFLSANYYYSKPNQRYIPALDEWKDSWDVGVQMQFDLWNWGATAAQARQAQATLAANQAIADQLRQNARFDIRRSDLSFRRSTDKVNVARLGVSQAEENVRMTTDKFRSGLSTSSELLDASLALLQAKTNFTGALVEREITKARLHKALGDPR